jgi:hypothetical protein
MFSVAGREYAVLDQISGGVFCLGVNNIINSQFGESNDWRTSYIREYLNRDYIETLKSTGTPEGAIPPLIIDLKETNGGREYGYDACEVGILTLEQYAKYNEYIPLNPDGAWWLATPWGTPKGRSPCTYSATLAWYVVTSGGYGCANCALSCGVRPALLLSSDLLVSQTVKQRQGVK